MPHGADGLNRRSVRPGPTSTSSPQRRLGVAVTADCPRAERAALDGPPTDATHQASLTQATQRVRGVSELLALAWADIRLQDLDDAEIEFAWQIGRQGQRQPTKTDGSARTVPMPRELATVLGARTSWLRRLKRRSDFVLTTRTGGPLRQRYVGRALRIAQRDAVTDAGTPTFPVLHRRDEPGQPIPVARGDLPSIHSFRHTVASRGYWLVRAWTRSCSCPVIGMRM